MMSFNIFDSLCIKQVDPMLPCVCSVKYSTFISYTLKNAVLKWLPSLPPEYENCKLKVIMKFKE